MERNKLMDDVAEWFVENRRDITLRDLDPILIKYGFKSKDVKELLAYIKTPRGQGEFKRILREKLIEE